MTKMEFLTTGVESFPGAPRVQRSTPIQRG